MTKYAALYCRLSPRPDGSYEGVDVQERAGRDYAASAWPDLPVVVFADAGISAANGDHRPRFEALREAVARGEVARLWTVEQTRLERREVEWFRLAAELDAAGLTELHTNRDGIVHVRDEVAGIKAVLAAGEVRKLKKRVNARLADIAAEGRPAGSRVYGYAHGLDEHGKKTLHIIEAEAEVIRDAAEKILAGWSLTRIATELRERGYHGPHRRKVRDGSGEVVTEADGTPVTRPSTITTSSVKSMVTNPTVAGLRVHQGRVVGRGVWEPILSEDVWHAVRNRLAAPRTVARRDGGTYPVTGAARPGGRRYLLTGGTAVCGVCSRPLVATMKQLRGRDPKPYYLCHPNRGGSGCVGIMADPFEEHVVRVLLDELDKPAFREALAVDEHQAERDRLTTALRALDGKRNTLAEQWADDELTAEEWRTARRALAERERELRAELAAVPPPVSNVDLDLVREAWPAMNLDERREIVGMFVARVVVDRARPGTRAFDPGRVTVEWR